MNHDGSGVNSGMVANLGSVVENIPYNHLIMARKGEEGRSGLVSLCLGIMCVLLEYQVDDVSPPTEIASERTGNEAEGLPASASVTQQSNSFRYFLAKLVCTFLKHSLSIDRVDEKTP